jgi:hypothetical protein
VDLAWLLLAVALCGGLAWLGLRIEPHHVSKDGKRIICQSQRLDDLGDPTGRGTETNVRITIDRTLDVTQKRFLRRTQGYWEVVAESPSPPRGRAIFLLRGRDDHSDLLTLRMPAKSRAVEELRALIPRSV